MFLEPFVAAFTDFACCTGDGGYGYGGVGRKEGEEAVIEIGEKEDFTVGEGGEQGGLVDAVEGAGFEFTYSVCACVSAGRFREKRARTRKKGGWSERSQEKDGKDN